MKPTSQSYVYSVDDYKFVAMLLMVLTNAKVLNDVEDCPELLKVLADSAIDRIKKINATWFT